MFWSQKHTGFLKIIGDPQRAFTYGLYLWIITLIGVKTQKKIKYLLKNNNPITFQHKN
jgi:hypothetical protein